MWLPRWPGWSTTAPQARRTSVSVAEQTDDSTFEVVGPPDNFWFWSKERGWDLTHPANRNSKPFTTGIRLEADINDVTIEPSKTALLIIDMQNYSMSSATFGRPPAPQLSRAEKQIMDLAIPAARKANIQIIWLNWGLTEKELQAQPPGNFRNFGWQIDSSTRLGTQPRPSDRLDALREFRSPGERPCYGGLGTDLGDVTLEDGSKVSAGRAMMRDTWNAAIHDPLMEAFKEGQKAKRPDVLVHKNRNSGLWNDASDLNKYLARHGIRTLIFTGMNTDQCIMGTLLDAQARGFDTIFLKDGCATDSPEYAQKCAEYNCQREIGFLSSCTALAEAAKSVSQ